MSLVEDVIRCLEPIEQWDKQCHQASLLLVRNGIGDVVARGTHPSVGGQHSWVVFGSNVYLPDRIIDPTLWSYDSLHAGVVIEDRPRMMRLWRPHGWRSFWEAERPDQCVERDAVRITVHSQPARNFLRMLGPLDRRGWGQFVNGPMNEVPARAEILEAILDTPELAALVPIDIVGMLTSRNPGRLYRAA